MVGSHIRSLPCSPILDELYYSKALHVLIIIWLSKVIFFVPYNVSITYINKMLIKEKMLFVIYLYYGFLSPSFQLNAMKFCIISAFCW